jgi:Tfp pilus assembly protein PilF
VSQLFDSLRRGRAAHVRATPARTTQGDAVLATLGYSPVRRSRSSVSVLGIAGAVLAIAAIWIGWQWYYPAPASAPVRTQRTPPPVRQSTPPSPPPAYASDARIVQAPPPQPVVPVPRAETAAPPIARSPARAALAPPSAPIATPPERATAAPASSDFELALYYHRAGDFENALQHYLALLQANEMNAQAHNNLGLLYQEKNLLPESARELQRAVLIEPRNAAAHNNYGVTLLLQEKPDEAAAEFRSALAVDPRSVDAMVNLALAERARNQPDVAKETLLKALAIAPRSAAAHYNLAQLYDQTHEAAAAIEHYRRFLETAGAEHAGRAAAVRARIAELSRTPE